ncbi:MAG: ATP-binding protein [Lentisphaerales bacterium]|jgi:predicted AAA+ superfamily ATPase|nr:MAG: ATP-binding protein [Lentisphaerales bacterium]
MDGELREVISRKIVDGLSMEVVPFTRRDIRLPAVPGKVMAVIGMRRVGKTTFLWQCLTDRLAAGTPREALLYFNFEDERLAGLKVGDLQWLPEMYYGLHPAFRDSRSVTFFLDEMQTVPGWETFVRRLLDTERIDLFISGSSARLLSREVATSMRGRALEARVHPFGFREALRHQQAEPDKPWERLPKAGRSSIEKRLREYLVAGGFPEAQGIPDRDRPALLRSYVDVALLRDVIERHAVSNPTVLRWMLQHLLGNPAANFSVQKFHDALKSQGIPVSKDTVHAYLGHLQDALIIRTITIYTSSERQRMVNPRKAYPADTGLIPIYERAGRANIGHALETAVMLELDRRDAEVAYVRTAAGREVDFHARLPDGSTWLLQVCADAGSSKTLQREIRALQEAAAAFPDAIPLLVTLDPFPPPGLPDPLRWQHAAAWLLGSRIEDG